MTTDERSPDSASTSELPVDSRVNLLLPAWDGTGWHAWIPAGNELIDLRPPMMSSGLYSAAKPFSDEDIHLVTADVLFQKATFPAIVRKSAALIYQLRVFSIAAAKLEHYHTAAAQIGPAVYHFAAAEVERVFVTARTSYDYLQECISLLWSMKRLPARSDCRRRQLPSSFGAIALTKTDDPASADEIQDKHQLPSEIAAAYAEAAPAFRNIRAIRDQIVHGLGSEIDVSLADRGFAVDPTESPFDRFDVWTEESVADQSRYSLMPLLGHVVASTIAASDALMGSLALELELPPDAVPGSHFYFRNPHNKALLRWLDAANGCNVWWDPESAPEAG